MGLTFAPSPLAEAHQGEAGQIFKAGQRYGTPDSSKEASSDQGQRQSEWLWLGATFMIV